MGDGEGGVNTRNGTGKRRKRTSEEERNEIKKRNTSGLSGVVNPVGRARRVFEKLAQTTENRCT